MFSRYGYEQRVLSIPYLNKQVAEQFGAEG